MYYLDKAKIRQKRVISEIKKKRNLEVEITAQRNLFSITKEKFGVLRKRWIDSRYLLNSLVSDEYFGNLLLPLETYYY